MSAARRLRRAELIAALRRALLALVDDEHSICEVSERLDIFCGGFGQWTFEELKKQYPTIVRSRPRLTQEELKHLANRWQLMRKQVMGTKLACDSQPGEGEFQTCRGWDEWSDDDLSLFYLELCGEEVEVLPDPAP